MTGYRMWTREQFDPFQPSPPPLNPTEGPKFFSGLDLGQTTDFSALVIVERTTQPDPERKGRTVSHFAVRHLARWPLKTSYVDIASDLKRMFADPPLAGSTLVVDKTGVGAPVVDILAAACIKATLRPLTITCGQNNGAGTVAKLNLVSTVQAALQSERLKFAAALELTPVLRRELETFRVSVNERTRNESFAAWREADHDDLVLALALALFVGSIPPIHVCV